jgi:DNA mismatch repair ATPase MutS
MTDRRPIKTGSKYYRDRLKRPKFKREYINKFLTHVKVSDKNNINWQMLQQIITETADEVIGKIETAE